MTMTDRRRQAVIRIEHLTRTYRLGNLGVHALRGVSLQIQRGEYVAIMGPSGSGKSTLMNILGCLDAPTRGRYLLDGIDIRRFDEDDLVGPAQPANRLRLSGLQPGPADHALANVELPLTYARVARTERARRPWPRSSRRRGGSRRTISQRVSGGQQQRVAIARALVPTRR